MRDSIYNIYSEYIKENEYTKIKTKEEEVKLFKAYRENNDLNARDRILFSNFKVSVSIAYKHLCNCKSITYNDLMQQTFIVLIKAMKEFDYTREVRFATYLYKVVDTKISRYVLENDREIRLSVNLQLKFTKILDAINVIMLTKGKFKNITFEDMKKISGVTKKDYVAFNKYYYPLVSLDCSISDDDEETTYKDFIKSEDNVEQEVEKREVNRILDLSIDKLKPEHKAVIRDIFFKEKDQHQLKEEYNVYVTVVGKRKRKALKELSKNKELISVYHQNY